MATLFGIDSTSLSEPRGAGATAIQGVQTPASQVTLPTGIMDIGVQVVRDVRKREEDSIKAATEVGQRKLLSDFTRVRTTVANSQLSIQEKTARMNAIDSQYQQAATEMGILDDFKKSIDLMKSNGITGEVASQEAASRKKYEDNVSFLRSNDVIVPVGAPESYVQALLENHASRETAIKRYQEEEGRFRDSTSRTRFSQEQADRLSAERANHALNQIAGMSLEGFNLQAKAITDSVLAGGNEEEGMQKLLELQMKTVGVINSSASHSPQTATVWRNQFESIISGYQEMITSRGASGERSINRTINTAALLAAQRNPEMLELAALNPYLGDNSISAVIASSEIASKIIGRLVSTNYQDTGVKGPNLVGSADNKGDEVATYAFIQEGLDSVRSGRADPAARGGYFQSANNILSMLGSKNTGEISAGDLRDVTDFMLSPEFVYLVKEGGLSNEAAASASRVFKQVYGEAADGNIREALMKELPSIGGEGLGGRAIYPEGVRTYSDVVDVTFQGGKLQFTPKKELQNLTARGNTPGIQATIRSTLRGQEDVLNRMVRVGAHLEGTTDYQKFWEENKAALMPYRYADPSRFKGNRVNLNGVEWEIIDINGRTDDPTNWRQVDGGN